MSTTESEQIALESTAQHTKVIERIFIVAHIMDDGPCVIKTDN